MRFYISCVVAGIIGVSFGLFLAALATGDLKTGTPKAAQTTITAPAK
jgi:hypothetical protein